MPALAIAKHEQECENMLCSEPVPLLMDCRDEEAVPTCRHAPKCRLGRTSRQRRMDIITKGPLAR
jgi:hypothetical protein